MTDCMTEWLDLKSDLNDKSFCHRLLCWPCDSSVAFCVALTNCDCCGVMKVLCCCPVCMKGVPREDEYHIIKTTSVLSLTCMIRCCHRDEQCRTCCGGCPTEAESTSAKELDDEPEEIPYTRVFEMEKKKRDKMKVTVQ